MLNYEAVIRAARILSEPCGMAIAGKADILDPLVALNRLGNASGHACSVCVERIAAVVTAPRLFYIPESSATSTKLGSPAFNLDGKPLGVFVVRALKGKGSTDMMTRQPENVTVIVLPAADILNSARQAPAAGEEKKGN